MNKDQLLRYIGKCRRREDFYKEEARKLTLQLSEAKSWLDYYTEQRTKTEEMLKNETD